MSNIHTLGLAKKKEILHSLAGQNWQENWPETSFVVDVARKMVGVLLFFLKKQIHWNGSSLRQTSERKQESRNNWFPANEMLKTPDFLAAQLCLGIHDAGVFQLLASSRHEATGACLSRY